MVPGKHCGAIAGAALLLPCGAAHAHGGISAIGALLPVFIGLWVVAAVLVVWVIASLILAFRGLAPERTGVLLAYRIFGWLLVLALALLAGFGALIMIPLASLVLLLLAGIIAAGTIVASDRATREEPELEDQVG